MVLMVPLPFYYGFLCCLMVLSLVFLKVVFCFCNGCFMLFLFVSDCVMCIARVFNCWLVVCLIVVALFLLVLYRVPNDVIMVRVWFCVVFVFKRRLLWLWWFIVLLLFLMVFSRLSHCLSFGLLWLPNGFTWFSIFVLLVFGFVVVSCCSMEFIFPIVVYILLVVFFWLPYGFITVV